MNLTTHYDQMWQQNLPLIAQNRLELDPYLAGQPDSRYGLTLLARPGIVTRQRIGLMLAELQQGEAAQYYYPEQDLHLTLLSLISCVPGFSLKQIEPQAYAALVRQALLDAEPMTIELRGITLSAAAVLVQGFVVSGALNAFRDKLRQLLQQSGLRHSLDSRYKLQTAHLTVLRFVQPLQQPKRFTQELQHWRHFEFGRMELTELELVGNDWYQRRAQQVPLALFQL